MSHPKLDLRTEQQEWSRQKPKASLLSQSHELSSKKTELLWDQIQQELLALVRKVDYLAEKHRQSLAESRHFGIPVSEGPFGAKPCIYCTRSRSDSFPLRKEQMRTKGDELRSRPHKVD
ncbi:hypothetical protein B0H13DRAFT_2284272 [Mycena leptocephala]|nr:hypothetical protein B0H13DRAFT_2284272 [Mycena leptocephala]